MPRKRRRPGVLAWVLAVLINFGLWVAYVGKLDPGEAVAGGIATLLGTLGVMAFAWQGRVKFRPSMHDLAQGWRIPWYMIDGALELLQALGKQLFTRAGAPSVVRGVPFRVGDNHSKAAARRALVVSYTTITPNFLVLGIARKRRLLLYHQVLPGEVLEVTRALGAEG